MPVITFEQALARTKEVKRDLLIGNGFSIALFPGRFTYASLLAATDFTEHPEAEKAFELLGTTDFEVVIDALRKAYLLTPLYGGGNEAENKMRLHAEALKELLVQAIAGKHPERPNDIGEAQYVACRKFLAHFIGEGRKEGKNLQGSVYTLNYDLLLYWTVLHEDLIQSVTENPLRILLEEPEVLAHDDGFRAPDEDPDAEYVTWDGESAHKQNIFYLHGALHLFDYGPQLQKKCWERTGGLALIDQIRTALSENRFPLFVSEGQSQQKLEHIRHSGYLHKGLRSFRGVCDQPSHVIFIFGHSLAENDAHVLRQIEKGKCQELYVSLYGDPSSEENRAIIARAELMKAARRERNSLEVFYFDSESAHVWG